MINTPRQPDPAADDPQLLALLDALTAAALAQDALSPATAVTLRYVLAILATDAMGDTCRFPRCACPVRDCSLCGPAGR